MMPVCLPRNKSRVCSSEWHVLAPPPPAAALRCWVEAQQPGERSSNFAAATLVSPVPSHLFVKRTESASFPNSRVLRWRPSVAVCVLGLCRWDYFMCVCLSLRSRWQGFREPSMSAFEVTCWWRQGSRVSTCGSLSASQINMKFL